MDTDSVSLRHYVPTVTGQLDRTAYAEFGVGLQP